MDMIGIHQTYMTWETVEGSMKSNPWTLIRVTGQKMASHRRQTSATLKKKIDQRWFCWPETCSRLLCGIKVLCVTVHFVLQCSFSASTSVGGESFVKRFGNIEPSFGYKIGFHLKALSQTLPNERQKITECLWLFDMWPKTPPVLSLMACWHLPQELRWRWFWGSIWCAVGYEFVVLVGRWLSWRSCSAHLNCQCDGKYNVKNRTGVTLGCCTCKLQARSSFTSNLVLAPGCLKKLQTSESLTSTFLRFKLQTAVPFVWTNIPLHNTKQTTGT